MHIYNKKFIIHCPWNQIVTAFIIMQATKFSLTGWFKINWSLYFLHVKTATELLCMYLYSYIFRGYLFLRMKIKHGKVGMSKQIILGHMMYFEYWKQNQQGVWRKNYSRNNLIVYIIQWQAPYWLHVVDGYGIIS